MNVAIYARVSKAGTVQDPENQLHELRRHLEKHSDWKLVREYVDYMSGAKKDRPEFIRMMRDCAKPGHAIDVVLVWSLDRFSREGTAETFRHMEALARLNVGFMSLQEPYIDTSGIFRDVIISLLSTLAKQERLRHIERVNAGLDNARRRGVKFGRKPVQIDQKALKKMVQADTFSAADVARAMGVSRTTAARAMRKVRGEQ